jgi:hypothetical protein
VPSGGGEAVVQLPQAGLGQPAELERHLGLAHLRFDLADALGDLLGLRGLPHRRLRLAAQHVEAGGQFVVLGLQVRVEADLHRPHRDLDLAEDFFDRGHFISWR